MDLEKRYQDSDGDQRNILQMVTLEKEWAANRIQEGEKALGKLDKINSWIEAYPLDIFPEPDLKKAAKILKENGMTLDAISASNMRHVLNGVSAIVNADT